MPRLTDWEAMKAQPRLSKARKEAIIMAYVMVTRGRLPTNLNNLLTDMRLTIPDLTESDLRKAIAWALKPKRPRARIVMRFIRVAAHRPQFPV